MRYDSGLKKLRLLYFSRLASAPDTARRWMNKIWSHSVYYAARPAASWGSFLDPHLRSIFLMLQLVPADWRTPMFRRRTSAPSGWQTVILLVSVLLVGCSGATRGPVNVRKVAPIDLSSRTFVLLSQTEYLADLAAELGVHGFRVRPLVRRGQGEVAVTGGGTGIALYEGAKYGLQIDRRFDQACAFTSSSIYAFTITIVDIESNEVVMVVRQTGADGPCTTVKPVWPTIAAAIAQNWGDQVQRDDK